MKVGKYVLLMDSMKKLLKNMEMQILGDILMIYLIISLFLQLLKEKSFVFMED